jgi:UDP-N-acetylmuramate dehydrogenase
MEFSYRRSALSGGGKLSGGINEADGPGAVNSICDDSPICGGIVLESEFLLEPGDSARIRARMSELAAKRSEKQPLNLPSAGSFFKRPEGHFAGKLIQDAGLSGKRIGGAEVSTLHCGFIVNRGGATVRDIEALMKEVQNEVFSRFGVSLEPEVRIIGEI